MRAIYPALLFMDNGEYVIQVPDVRGCVTTGESIEDALDSIRDALGGCLCVLEDEGEQLPTPSEVSKIQSNGASIFMIDIDLIEYRRATDTRAVRKNVSMPAWMSYLADKRGLNCSQILQDAIRQQLGIV